MRQESLFGSFSVDQDFDANVERHRFELRELDIGDITFAAGQQEAVHRWYRLTPSYSPALVRHFFHELGVSGDSLVLDPFSGRGTTAIECQKHGIRAEAFEVNPLLQIVGQNSLHWRREAACRIRDFLAAIAAECESLRDLELEAVLAKLGTELPNIHDVFRWWRRQVLRDLLVAKSVARSEEFADVADLLWLVMTTASINCANIHRNHPTITFDDHHDREIDVVGEIHARAAEVARDLESMSDPEMANVGRARVSLVDSCTTEVGKLVAPRTVTHILTSPPYPNRYSYVHQTRPQLHFMDVLKSRTCATEVDLKTIGGTWGRATSSLMKELIEPPAYLRPLLDYWEQLSKESVLMCNYATKYFIDLDRHIKAVKGLLAPNAVCAYVVGNSRLSDVEIYTETILARIFEVNDFAVDRIDVFRKRGGRKRLYETAVIARSG